MRSSIRRGRAPRGESRRTGGFVDQVAQNHIREFLITMAKNIESDRSAVTEEEARLVSYSRKERWIGRRPIATEQ
jgi:hypothetical protein